MEILRQDLRFAWRMLRAVQGIQLHGDRRSGPGNRRQQRHLQPGAYGILLRPLPFPDADRLVMIWDRNPKGIDRNSVSPPNFADYRAGARSLARGRRVL